MAVRFVYKPITEKPYVESVPVQFKWESGMAITQRTKSSLNLHTEAVETGIAIKLLECSRAGETDTGERLSAFNLPYYADKTIKVENVYQGSKVFREKETGKLVWLANLYKESAMTAKKNPILTSEDYQLEGFKLFETGYKFPTSPGYAFYNYIYIKSLRAILKPAGTDYLLTHDGFTDIMLRWYGGKVTSCQAHAVAMFVGMVKAGTYDYHMNTSLENYLEIYNF